MLEMYRGRKARAAFEFLAQYFLSKNVPSRIDLINAISTGFRFTGSGADCPCRRVEGLVVSGGVSGERRLTNTVLSNVMVRVDH